MSIYTHVYDIIYAIRQYTYDRRIYEGTQVYTLIHNSIFLSEM